MKTTYIYIDDSTKGQLIKISKQKKLSLSTVVNIIKNHYQFRAAAYGNKYVKKGNNKIHLKLQDENKSYPEIKNDILTTNAIYEWAEKPTKEIDYQKIDSQIQSEMDKTIDPFYDYNNQVRKLARAIRENPKYYERLLERTKK